MKRNYFCPKCQSLLNPNVKIVLTAQKDRAQGLILFSPQPGNYDAIVPDDLRLQPGDLVEFRCPVCGTDLTSSRNPNLAEIGFRFASGDEGRVGFSRRYGEQATYFVTQEDVKTYGEHAGLYGGMNYFGAGGPADE